MKHLDNSEFDETELEDNMMKDLGAKAFSYGYASPVLMAATYNDDGSVNVMSVDPIMTGMTTIVYDRY